MIADLNCTIPLSGYAERRIAACCLLMGPVVEASRLSVRCWPGDLAMLTAVSAPLAVSSVGAAAGMLEGGMFAPSSRWAADDRPGAQRRCAPAAGAWRDAGVLPAGAEPFRGFAPVALGDGGRWLDWWGKWRI
jgi:hypothetical protein